MSIVETLARRYPAVADSLAVHSIHRKPRWFYLGPGGDLLIVGGETFLESKRCLRRFVRGSDREHFDYDLIGYL